MKLALRTLFKTPFVTVVAIVSLALGIGANVAIFSMFEQILLRPLPVHEPDRLVNLGAPGPKPGSTSCSQSGSCEEVFSYPMFRDLERAENTAFAGVAAHRNFGSNIAYQGQTVNGTSMQVSGSYFPVLGLRPALGRLFTPDDDRTIGGHFVTVLSYTYWETTLGADPGIIGQRITINGHPMTVIGVAPPDFNGTTLGTRPLVYVPITMRSVMSPTWRGFENRRSYWVYVFARLKPGVAMEQALASANAVYRPIINDVEVPLQQGMSEQTMARFRARELTIADGRRGQSSMHREARTPLVLLFSVTGIVLLIACANIANLLLARAANRQTEMAVRLSLGATRMQVLRQLLLEACILAAIGGAASLLVAHWTLGFIASVLPAQESDALRFGIKPAALMFTAALSMGTGLLFGIFPALNATRPDLITSLRSGVGKHSGARSAARFRTTLVTVQIALSMALLIPAGLFIQSLRNVSKVDLGVRVDNLVTFSISPQLNGYAPARSAAFFQRVEAELAALPGVTSVSSGMVALLSNNNWGSDVNVEGFERGPDTDANASFNLVGPGYFQTVGMPLLAGRDFTASDGPGSTPVAIVNESFARKFGLGRDAVGKRMSRGDSVLNIHIVGLVKDAKYSSVRQETPPVFFQPARQDTTLGFMNFYVRTAVPPEQILRAIPPLIARLDANLPVARLMTMPQQIRENTFLDRMISTLSASFALLATLLAAVGLYGVLAYSVAQRTREIGVRMALGADARQVQRMVLRQVGIMAAVGGAIGIVAALGIGRGARSLLFELEAHDPLVFAGSIVVLTLVALGAAYLPALKASRVDPIQALRYE